MFRWKTVLFNISFALNCLLLFLLVFESGLMVPVWLQTVGRMHPLMLHFPIVLMVLCIFWELIAGINKPFTKEQVGMIDWLLLITSITAVWSALMGLFLSKEEGYTGDTVLWHKWAGVALSFVSLAWYNFRNQIRQKKWFVVSTVIAATIAVTITGHLGANITHVEEFLLAPLFKDEKKPAVLLSDAAVFTDMVQPILQAKCVSCHNEQKAKGELLMTTEALLLKGGKSGQLWDTAKSDLGLLMKRIHLPSTDKEHMPPTGKPQLTEAEIKILYQWIKSGASFTTKLKDLPATDSLKILAAAQFKTIETDDYDFDAASETKVKELSNNYRLITPLAQGSPALRVEFFSAAQFKPDHLKEILDIKEQVVSLNLNKMPVTDDDLSTIAKFSNLRRLNLSFTNIKGNRLDALKGLDKLKELSLSGTGVNAEQLAVLASLPKLTNLYIWTTPAQSQDLTALKKKLKAIQIETGFTGDTVVLKLNAPIIENEAQVLTEPTPLIIKHYIKGASIRYTTDGTEPDSIHSLLYKEGIKIHDTFTIKAKAFKKGWMSSSTAQIKFFKGSFKIDTIILSKLPDPPYHGIGTATLTDGMKSNRNYRSGKWLGYREPLKAFLMVNGGQTFSTITVSALVDVSKSVMPPKQIEVWGGKDTGHLQLIKKIIPEQPTKTSPGNFITEYKINLAGYKGQFLKLILVPVASLPAWHISKGTKGWVFVDEIYLN